MKHDKVEDGTEPRPFALLVAIAIVLGILVDHTFFIVAALMTLLAPVNWLFDFFQKHQEELRLQRRQT
jgi:hypothetical protein